MDSYLRLMFSSRLLIKTARNSSHRNASNIYIYVYIYIYIYILHLFVSIKGEYHNQVAATWDHDMVVSQFEFQSS